MIFRVLGLCCLSLVISSQTNAQKQLISKDSAILVAIAGGLETGLHEYQVSLEHDTIWKVISLLCDDESQRTYDLRKVNAKTGKIINEELREVMIDFNTIVGGRIEGTHINTDYKIDNLPFAEEKSIVKIPENIKHFSNPMFSSDDKFIAFAYGYNKVGLVRNDGSGFNQICDSCQSPIWMSNEWILFSRNDRYLYKKKIYTNEEVRLTHKPIWTNDFKVSPNGKWIAYTSMEVYPNVDSLGKPILYASVNGQGINLCLIAMDGNTKKYITKVWKNVHHPIWTANSDTILFYIEDQKYFATGLNTDSIHYSQYTLLPKLNLWDYEKVVNGVFPYKSNCQLLEISANNMLPTRILVSEIGRYGNICISHNLKYFVFSKLDLIHNPINTWIIEVK
jgi:hypothetical protein